MTTEEIATQKDRAHGAMSRAIDRGDLVRAEFCEECGVKPNRTLHGHHADYSKPLDVEWLCAKCHRRRHGLGYEAVPIGFQVSPDIAYLVDLCRRGAPDGEAIPSTTDIMRRALAQYLYSRDEHITAMIQRFEPRWRLETIARLQTAREHVREIAADYLRRKAEGA